MPTTDDIIREIWEVSPLVASYVSVHQAPVVGNPVVLNDIVERVSHCRRPLSASAIRTAESFLRDAAWRGPNTPATAYGAHNIPNGQFVVQLRIHNGISRPSVNYQIYTVQSGRHAGKRVIKVRDPESSLRSGFSAFAFLNHDHSWTLWSRFTHRQDENFISWLPDSLQALALWSGGAPTTTVNERLRFTVDLITCRVCNSDSYGNTLCEDHHRHLYGDSSPVEAEEYEAVQDYPEPSWRPADGRTEPLTMCEVTGEEVQ